MLQLNQNTVNKKNIFFFKNNHLIKVPSILTKIENYLYNDQLNDNSVNILIKFLKEEWLKYELIFYELDFIKR